MNIGEELEKLSKIRMLTTPFMGILSQGMARTLRPTWKSLELREFFLGAMISLGKLGSLFGSMNMIQ